MCETSDERRSAASKAKGAQRERNSAHAVGPGKQFVVEQFSGDRGRTEPELYRQTDYGRTRSAQANIAGKTGQNAGMSAVCCMTTGQTRVAKARRQAKQCEENENTREPVPYLLQKKPAVFTSMVATHSSDDKTCAKRDTRELL